MWVSGKGLLLDFNIFIYVLLFGLWQYGRGGEVVQPAGERTLYLFIFGKFEHILSPLREASRDPQAHAHTRTHIAIGTQVCVCVCV